MKFSLSNFTLGVLFAIFLMFGIRSMYEDAEGYAALRERINGSTVLSCTSATGRGPRGETYHATVYKLIDEGGMEWLYTPRYLQYEQLKCPAMKGD